MADEEKGREVKRGRRQEKINTLTISISSEHRETDRL